MLWAYTPILNEPRKLPVNHSQLTFKTHSHPLSSKDYSTNLATFFSLSAIPFSIPSYTFNSLFILSCHLDYMHVERGASV